MAVQLDNEVGMLAWVSNSPDLTDHLFVINVHGTENGRAETFPVGISQLMASYSGVPNTLSGTDIYLGELTVANAADLYLVNAFSDAVHDADQPLTSMELRRAPATTAATCPASTTRPPWT